jgi:hypothetical protein
MARIPDLRQIKKEDYDQKDQKLIDQLAFPLNNFMQQVITVLKHGIDFNNLNQQIVTFTVSVDAQGKPTKSIQFQNTLATKVIGIMCISALNTSSTIRYPQATPFISYTMSGNLVTVNNISGLGIPAGQTNSDIYTFTILTIGQNLSTS